MHLIAKPFPNPLLEVISIFEVEVCFFYTTEVCILFSCPFFSLCLFIGELRPLILSAINDQWLLIPVLFQWEWLCVSLPWVLLMWGYLLLEFLWVKLASLGWGFPSSTFCKAGFVDIYCLSLVLSWNILFPPLMVIEMEWHHTHTHTHTPLGSGLLSRPRHSLFDGKLIWVYLW